MPSRLTSRVKTVRQTPYKLAVCFAGGSLNPLFRDILITVGDVGRYRPCKQHGVLCVGYLSARRKPGQSIGHVPGGQRQ